MAQPETTKDSAAKPKSELALIKSEVVDKTASTIDRLVQEGRLHMPADYSPQNAVTQAWLVLQEVKDRNDKPALEACTRASIYSAILDMCVQGLNPAKRQCYFIAYGSQLVCQRSYFGDMALARRVSGKDLQFSFACVCKGDEFAYDIVRGLKVPSVHKQTLETANAEILAAYCVVQDADGTVVNSEVMTIERIKRSWSMSKTYKEGGSSPHTKFADAMALRTVIRKACTPIINASDDGSLLFQAMKRSEEEAVLAEVAEEEAERANKEVIDVEPVEAKDAAAAGQPALHIDGGPEGARPEF